MLVTCTRCPARGQHCEGCVITAMQPISLPGLNAPAWDEDDLDMLAMLCDAGLVDDAGAALAQLEWSREDRISAVG